MTGNPSLNDPEIDIYRGVNGRIEPAKTIQTAALKAGKDVVTANKKMLASEGKDIFSLATSWDACRVPRQFCRLSFFNPRVPAGGRRD